MSLEKPGVGGQHAASGCVASADPWPRRALGAAGHGCRAVETTKAQDACDVRALPVLGGPDGRRFREFHTARDEVSKDCRDRSERFPAYFPVRMPQCTIATEPASSGRTWRIPPNQWLTIRARLRNGESLRALASAYGVSHETIRRILRTSRPAPARVAAGTRAQQ